jgi:type II secretory pathway pseudopilin PulG
MNNKLSALRSGLTIIEVMTSIVVAMIGVMGVMILVPFAVRQAQTGLDNEAAAVVARNAYNQFEIGGYRNHANWLVLNANGNVVRTIDLPAAPDSTTNPVPAPPFFPQPYSIDPLGITESGDYATTFFPFNLDPTSSATYPPIYRIPAANLNLPVNALLGFNKAHARRMFQTRDDLIFAEAQNSAGQTDAQLNGPSQVFDVEPSAGAAVRRQAGGRFSWSAIAVPNKLDSAPVTNVSNWKLYMLVYKDRVTDVNAIDTPNNISFSPKMRAADVLAPIGQASPVSTIRIGASIPTGSIKKDEWVMLINRKVADPNYPAGHGYDWQIAFYRVVNYRSVSATESLLTLDGPDFRFDDPSGTPRYQATYCVHLKNVVSVFERTISPEGNSVWNLAF